MVTFKAEGAADVLMFDEVAQALMEVMGKERGARGVVTVEQLPDALERLKRAVALDRAAPRALERRPRARDEDEPERFVSLTQRALPLIELLEHARAREVPVVWGI
ncbi:MAG: hypothetical protein Fur0039_00060 [Rhodocyclaceae bacterium]